MPASAISEGQAVRWTSEGGLLSESIRVAEEVPLALIYNGEPFSVMMVSPVDLENFVIGFSITEKIVDNAREISGFEFVDEKFGISAYVSIDKRYSDALTARKKNLVGRTGCGICGKETLEETLGRSFKVTNDKKFKNGVIQRAIKSLSASQTLNIDVGTLHGAAWADAAGNIAEIREDVGRHNALDKLIGVLMSTNLGSRDGFALITSRASYEMVSKASAANIGMLVAVSGPTSLAINTAKESGITLLGFARDGRQTIYVNKQRIII